jgi:two-component system chemotaxis response regulator CheB
MSKIRVLIVDDSALMRKKIKEMIESDPKNEVIDLAKNGKEALEKIKRLKPDVVTLDVQMPEMDGLICLAHIMNTSPTPVVIMLSAFTHGDGEATIRALELGAVDFVHKPSGMISLNIERVKDELLTKIDIAHNVKIKKLKNVKTLKKPKIITTLRDAKKIVVIGGSTGGPRALSYIVPRISTDINAAIIIAQHIPFTISGSMAERLNNESQIVVKEAKNNDLVKAGEVLIVPGNHNMIVRNENNSCVAKLFTEKQDNYSAPSINILMSSIAPIFKENTIGVLLTGMGQDGTEGFKMIKAYGGITIAEAESTCIVYGMPKSAISAGVVDYIKPLEEIPETIIALVKKI